VTIGVAQLEPQRICSDVARDRLPAERRRGTGRAGFDPERQVREHRDHGRGQSGRRRELEPFVLEPHHRGADGRMQLLDQAHDRVQRALERRVGRDQLEHAALAVGERVGLAARGDVEDARAYQPSL